MTKLLNREAILKANDLPTRDVSVPEWGGTVRVRSLTAADREQIETAFVDANEAGEALNGRARYAAAAIIGDDGAALFTVDDVNALAMKSAAALDRVHKAVADLNRLGEDGVEAAAKN